MTSTVFTQKNFYVVVFACRLLFGLLIITVTCLL